MQVDIGAPYVSAEPVQALASAPGTSQNLIAERRTLVGAVTAVNQSSALGLQRELSFLVDRASRRLVVRIVDTETGDVVSQIPSERVLEMAAQLPKRGLGSDPPQSSSPLVIDNA
jgi:flagellar protein FlaG